MACLENSIRKPAHIPQLLHLVASQAQEKLHRTGSSLAANQNCPVSSACHARRFSDWQDQR